MGVLFPKRDEDTCRVCPRPVVDGRWNYCSERCRDIARAVQKMYVWDEVREAVLKRDDYTCQSCGLTKEMRDRAYWQTHELAKEKTEDSGDFWEVWRSYGNTERPSFHVDHIERIADGGHPFDETNLQTLCEECHHEKTAEENSNREPAPEITLEDYLEA